MITPGYTDKKTLSLYQPSSDVSELNKMAKGEFDEGHQILTRAWPELNDMSVIDRDQKDKRTFNAYVDESCDDPKEAWKWRGTRSMARNRGMAMHAHLTAGFIFPMVSAQDMNNEEDRGMGDFMRSLLIWMGENSNYRESFLQMTNGILTSPVTYMEADYAEVMQKIRFRTAEGYDTKEVLDQELSGFRTTIYGASEVMITNAYQQNIQRQSCVIKTKYIDIAEAKKRYGHHENFQFVQKGVNSVFNEEDGLFYDVKDNENLNSVREVTLSWRGDDMEVCYLGGIYMGNENTEWNPMKHRDNFGNPKYNAIPFGYSRISEHFFYFKSLMNQLSWDDRLLDAMYENTMNREFLDLDQPTLLKGFDGDEFNTSVAFPGATIMTPNVDASAQPLLLPSRSNAYQALQTIEESLKEGSISDTQMGQLPQATQKAFSVAKADQSAKTMLRGVSNSLGLSIIQFGSLMVDIAINNLSTAQIDDIAGEKGSIFYRQFILSKKSEGGRSKTKVLRFQKDLVGREMSKEQKSNYGLKLKMEAGEGKTIMEANPEVSSRMKYLIHIDPEEMFVENKEYRQQILTQMYELLRQDPLINPEVLVKKLAHAIFRSEGDDLIAKKSDVQSMMAGAQGSPDQILSDQNYQMRQFMKEGGVEGRSKKLKVTN